MKLFKNFEYFSVIFLVLVSLLLLSFPYLSRGNGVKVVSISGPCEDVLTPGSIITEAAGYKVSNEEEFYSLIEKLKGPTTFVVDYNPRSCYIPEDKSLNITVIGLRKSILRFGIDLIGGKRYLYELREFSEDALKETLERLEKRRKFWELSNTRIRSLDGEIEIITGKDEEEYLSFLTKKGELEGGFLFNVELREGKGIFSFNEKDYEIERVNDEISVNEITHRVNEKFMLDGVEFYVKNVSSNNTLLIGKVFNGKDLRLVEGTLNPTRLIRQRGGYVFVIYISLSEEASKNFKKLTISQDVNVNPLSGESFLASPLVVFVDEKEFINVPISGENKGLEIKNLALWSFETNREDAVKKMTFLASLIKFGSLPTDLILKGIESYGVEEGKDLFLLPTFTFIILSIPSSLIFMKKYKKVSLTIPSLILCGVITFLGVMSFPVLLVLVFGFGLIISFRKEWLSGWLSVLTVFMLFISMVGILMERLILETYSIYGLTAFIAYGFLSLLLVGFKLKKGETRSVYRILWKMNSVVAFILVCLFFMGASLTEFSIPFLVNFIFYTTITTPLFLEEIKSKM